jgi:hypothetical protein
MCKRSSPSPATSLSSSSSSSSSCVKKIKNTSVHIMFVDATKRNQLPTTDLQVLDMQTHGNYHADVVIHDETSFNSFLKMNGTSGEYFAKDYYFYSLLKKHSREISPTSYHKHNFSSKLAIAAIYKGKYLIVSPVCQYSSHKKSSFNVVTVNGALVIEDSSDDSIMSDNEKVVSPSSSSFLTPKKKECNVDDDNVDENA